MKRLSPITLLTMLALIAPSAFAALGGTLSSVATDQANMQAMARAERHSAGYAVHESQTPAGTTVREYTAGNGTVFGVAWKGPVPPDLRQILGQYFEPYTKATNLQHAGHSHLLVRQADLVVQSHGHLRAFSGSAYVPSLLPQGISTSDIQ